MNKKIYKSKELLDSFKTNPVEDFIYLHSNWWRALWWNLRYVKAPNLYQYKKDIRFKAVENFAITYSTEIKEKLLIEKNIDNQNAAFKFLDYKVFDLQTKTNANQKYICIVIGVGKLRPNRAYPVTYSKALIERILEETDYQVKILGGADEKQMAEYLSLILKGSLLDKYSSDQAEKFYQRVENLVARTDLMQIIDVLKDSSHVFSADTGLLHIAAALDLEISSVFSITSENRTGPFNPRARTLRGDCTCKPDNSNSKKHCTNLIDGYAACMWQLKADGLLDLKKPEKALF